MVNMKKVFFFFTLLVNLVLNAVSQENFVPGRILTLNHDTLKGLLDYRDWELNPGKIRYKDTLGEVKTFRPQDIRAFWISKDVVYLSKHLAMDVSNYRLEDLARNASVRMVRDTAVFVRLIVSGQMNLYFLRDAKDKDHYWFQNKNDSIYEMRITRRMVSTEGMAHQTDLAVATLNLYQIILPGVVADCPSVSEKAKTVEFSMQAFTKIAVKYNECISGDKTMVVSKQKKVKATFGLVAGTSLVSLKFFGADDIMLTHATFPSVWTYTGGISLKIILPYLNGSWIIYNDLVYRPYYVYTEYDNNNIIYQYLPGNSSHYTYSFTMGYLKLNTMLRYQFPKWAVKPFVNVGMSNSYALINKNHSTTTITTSPTPYVTYKEGPAVPETKNYEAGFVCGIGACFKELGLEFRYEWANGMSAYTGYTGSENSYSFLLSFTFGQK
jgi:hypothetical protein